MAGVAVTIHRGSRRAVERERGRLSRHSFSFGAAYDPENLSFGPMVCHDDHLLGKGQGFDTHRHRDIDIVTWVVSGALRHTDDTRAEHTVGADSVALLRTGDGVAHSEIAAAPQTRFVQVWLRSEYAGEPTYSVTRLEPAPGVPVTAAELDGARFSVVRLAAGEPFTLPAVPQLHVYVARGALLRFSLAEPLAEGDAFRCTDEPEHPVTAGVPTDLLLWSFS